MLFGLMVGASAVATGCTKSDPGAPPTTASQARLVVSTQGSGTTTLRVSVTSEATAEVAFDRMIDVAGDTATVINLSVAPSTYTFTAGVLSGDALLGTSSAQAALNAGETTQVALAAQFDQATGTGSATVQVGVDVAPQITGVSVQASAGARARTRRTPVHVDARDVGGDALTFFWSGAGLLPGAVQGSSTLSLSTAAIAAAASTGHAGAARRGPGHAKGAATAASIALTVAGADVQGAMAPGGGAPSQACLDAQAQCNASCAPGLALGAAQGERERVVPHSRSAAGCPLVSCDGT